MALGYGKKISKFRPGFSENLKRNFWPKFPRNYKKMRQNFFNPQAVGMDSGVPFSLSNFLEDIFTANNFQNVTNVKFRSLALIFNS